MTPGDGSLLVCRWRQLGIATLPLLESCRKSLKTGSCTLWMHMTTLSLHGGSWWVGVRAFGMQLICCVCVSMHATKLVNEKLIAEPNVWHVHALMHLQEFAKALLAETANVRNLQLVSDPEVCVKGLLKCLLLNSSLGICPC